MHAQRSAASAPSDNASMSVTVPRTDCVSPMESAETHKPSERSSTMLQSLRNLRQDNHDCNREDRETDDAPVSLDSYPLCRYPSHCPP